MEAHKDLERIRSYEQHMAGQLTAAAYTEMRLSGASMPPEDEMDFVLDRPFLFAVISDDQMPLFVGIVNQP